MIDHRAFAGTRLATAVICAGATAVALGLALAGAGAASADDGNTIQHDVDGLTNTPDPTVANAGTDVHPIVDGLGMNLSGARSGSSGPAGAPTTSASHPINARSLRQVQSLYTKNENLTVIIVESHIQNSNSTAALEELAQGRRILLQANTLAEGIQNGTIPRTQEKQVLIYIAQAHALEAQAHARLRNNIN